MCTQLPSRHSVCCALSCTLLLLSRHAESYVRLWCSWGLILYLKWSELKADTGHSVLYWVESAHTRNPVLVINKCVCFLKRFVTVFSHLSASSLYVTHVAPWYLLCHQNIFLRDDIWIYLVAIFVWTAPQNSFWNNQNVYCSANRQLQLLLIFVDPKRDLCKYFLTKSGDLL